MERYSLDDLRLFVAIARHQSFARAAAELRTAPSTLSRRLATFEAAIGNRLLQRTSRRVALTAEGEELLERAGPLVEDVLRVAEATLGGARAPRGPVRVTAPVASGAEWVAAALVRLAKQHPELRIELRLTNEVEDLVDARIDVAVRAGPLAPSRFVARRLRTIGYSFYAAPSFVARRLAGATRLDLRALKSTPAVVAREGTSWRLRATGGARRVVSPAVRFVVNDPRVAIAAAADGVGIVCAADEMVARYGSGLVRLGCHGHSIEPRSLFVVTPARKSMPARTRAVVEAIIAAARAPATLPSAPA